MKGFPSSDQNSDDTSARKHDLCDFETSLIIQIRHDSGKERDMCTNNGNLHFFHFFPFFKTLERILNTSVDSHNSFKRKKVSNRKVKKNSPWIWHPTTGCFKNFKNKTKKQRRSGQAPGRTCTEVDSHNDGKRGYMVCTLQTILSTTCVSVTCMCVCECLRAHVRLIAKCTRGHTRQKLKSEKWRSSRTQIKLLTTLQLEYRPLWFLDKSQNSHPTWFRQRLRIVH